MKIEQAYDGEWYKVADYPYNVCCDCGLVHRLEIRKHKGKFEIRAFRDDQETARVRRGKK